MSRFFQHTVFVLRYRYTSNWMSVARKTVYGLLGMRAGKKLALRSVRINWPHQVLMGNGCIIEHGVSFKFDNPWVPGPNIKLGDRVFVGSMCEFNITESISIGNDTNIASGCRFIDHNHGIALGTLIGLQPNPKAGISIGEGVWLGCNVVVLMGVTIEEGAVVAAGAVVTKSIPPNEIWGGVPAKKIGERK